MSMVEIGATNEVNDRREEDRRREGGWTAYFGGEDDLVTYSSLLHPFADERLRGPILATSVSSSLG